MKIKFLFLGGLNCIFSNIILQILLLLDFIPIILSTIIFIFFNTILGFFLYSKLLFNKKNVFKRSYIIKYLILLFFSWIILNLAIFVGIKLDISPKISSILIIPMIAANSYLIQKSWVFN